MKLKDLLNVVSNNEFYHVELVKDYCCRYIDNVEDYLENEVTNISTGFDFE